MIGYDYVYVGTNNAIATKRAYFQKDIHGNVVGLFNEDGGWIATYSYDAWGNLTHSTMHKEYTDIVSANHIKYKGYYYDDESGFYYLGKSYYVPELSRMLSVDEPENIIKREVNIGNTQLGYNNYMYSSGNPVSIPTDIGGYELSNNSQGQVTLCDTSNLIFESMKTFNTNCYGFVINCWKYSNMNLNIYPGIYIGANAFGTNHGYVPCMDVANYVKQDVNYMGKDAQILTGADNNPYYETDDEHCLIAVRVMSEKDYQYYTKPSDHGQINHIIDADSYHFMIRRDDGWYFKSGYHMGIFKLTGNNTPSTVDWSQYMFDGNGNISLVCEISKFYTSEIQYMVISKMPLRIE